MLLNGIIIIVFGYMNHMTWDGYAIFSTLFLYLKATKIYNIYSITVFYRFQTKYQIIEGKIST